MSLVDNGDGDDEVEQGRKRPRTRDHTEYSQQWYPWSDRITCTLDVLMHLPRSVFSHRQLEPFIWLLKVNNVDDVPSVKSMQELNAMIQTLCGIESIPYNGALGHKYYVNSLAQIISQEMLNPKVRPHLDFYPEDSGKILEEARQGKRWLEEIPSEQTTPMVRIGAQDYFIYEPAMLRDGTCCMPIRWFVRDKVLFAKCWDLEVVNSENGRSWRVIQRESEVSQHDLMKNLPDLREDFQRYDVPDPSKIQDIVDPASNKAVKWTLTNPVIGNSWREHAKGSRVVAFPIWLYCDDTSGNLSKKWNEHNSFLFTPAGLSREQAAKEFNIHFLSTSNIAPPLEMLDGILDQLEAAQKDGIWAWDIELSELVLVIPTVLALLGDNPMQSEFACHIGLRGKYFCRACWVKGSDNLDEAEEEDTGRRRLGSDAESESGQPKGRGKKESLEQMMARAKSFVKVIGKPRTKVETTAKLRSYFTEASTVNTKTKVKNMCTASGIKDTFQMVFLEQLFDSYKGKRGKAKQAALDAKLLTLPKNITSPVWRIKGLDPHQDTPVEILHVILLGFVKYMWRDVVQNQLKNKADKKKLLETRLNSFDVSGLGISPLAGHTLVQYSGSLTGRDFRAIAQAAPFVVYDLVSPDCLATWVALSKLIPLVWQPKIKDIDAHITLLTAEINHFLACAARWTTRWFNKPKFHILLHLPEHIRRFGPAILFATEAFESFNAIIRAKSVHSNRHAPSRDIARAFAQGNRIRHLLSGGLFMQAEVPAPAPAASIPAPATSVPAPATSVPAPSASPSREKKDWKSAGRGPLSLVTSPNTLAPRLFSATLTAQKLPQALPPTDLRLIQTGAKMYLENGDLCELQQFVICRRSDQITMFVGRIAEILQIRGTPEAYSQRPSAILLQTVTISNTADDSYGMPAIQLQDHWLLVKMADILCTVNVQHNCVIHSCGPTGARPVYQEREETTQTRPVIVHKGAQNDLLLNTAQMRDAANLQRFRVDSVPLDADEIIMASVLREFEIKKAAAVAAAETLALVASSSGSDVAGVPSRGRGGRGGRARGAGRGRPGPQRVSELQAGTSPAA
ncbi:hypothetical protein DFH06DRAFT_1004418 [Mycena polygramma]|nr:hypothetical protein DFH06DRAFT_1004418 [Mycena polygramma]